MLRLTRRRCRSPSLTPWPTSPERARPTSSMVALAVSPPKGASGRGSGRRCRSGDERTHPGWGRRARPGGSPPARTPVPRGRTDRAAGPSSMQCATVRTTRGAITVPCRRSDPAGERPTEEPAVACPPTIALVARGLRRQSRRRRRSRRASWRARGPWRCPASGQERSSTGSKRGSCGVPFVVASSSRRSE